MCRVWTFFFSKTENSCEGPARSMSIVSRNHSLKYQITVSDPPTVRGSKTMANTSVVVVDLVFTRSELRVRRMTLAGTGMIMYSYGVILGLLFDARDCIDRLNCILDKLIYELNTSIRTIRRVIRWVIFVQYRLNSQTTQLLYGLQNRRRIDRVVVAQNSGLWFLFTYFIRLVKIATIHCVISWPLLLDLGTCRS